MVKYTIKIAVTGGPGSGKSTVCNIFRKLGLLVFDTDRFARDVVKKNTVAYRQIIEYFGKQVVEKDGNLNRRLLRQIITTNVQAKNILEKIVHPEIILLMKEKMVAAQQNGTSIVIEVPLLFELKLENLFDLSIMLYSTNEHKIVRLENRDNITRQNASDLISLQMPDEEKMLRSDFLIENNGSKEQLEKDVKKLYEKIFDRKWRPQSPSRQCFI
jgi:dephospho-CoA kinase